MRCSRLPSTAICIPSAVDAAKGSNIAVGAQNVHFKESGAYTGELAANMLTEAGVKYVIIGHSERRQYFGETDETVNLRTKAALAGGLIAYRIALAKALRSVSRALTDDTVRRQTKIAFLGIHTERLQRRLSSRMSLFGQSVRAKPQQRTRLTKFAALSVKQ